MNTNEVRFEKLNMSDNGQFRQMVIGAVYETMVDFSVRKMGDRVYEFKNIFATTRPIGSYLSGIELAVKKHSSIVVCAQSVREATQTMLRTVHNKNIERWEKRQ